MLFVCFFIFIIISPGLNVLAESSDEIRAELNSQIDELSGQIDAHRVEIEQARKQKKTLKNELWIIGSEVKKINLEIKEADLMIEGLEIEMTGLQDKIAEIDARVDEQRVLIAGIIRMINEKDKESLLEIVLDKNRFSDFFDEIKAFEDLELSLNEYLDEIKLLKVDSEAELEILEEKRGEFFQIKSLQERQRVSLNNKQNESSRLLKETQGREHTFQQLIKQKEKDIQAIRQRLYLLEGSGVSMSLEEALRHAEFASDRTGVRPAFLLALLQVESRWGGNTGSGNWRDDMYECYLRLADYYSHKKAYYQKRARDEKNAFMQITGELGLNPDSVFVSAEPYYGCGGAMGPAQFIPTTWLSYQDEIAAVTGHNPPSPWSLDDSFTAAAIKLSNDGASKQTYTAEREAAMTYLGGRKRTNVIYRYGNQVMDLAASIQREVDLISN